MKRTWVEINLSALRYNLRQIRKKLANKAKILAVIKDNAYGHGLLKVSQTLVKERIDYLGISNLREARELRKAGIKTPILNLGGISCKEEAEEIVRYEVAQTVYSRRIADLLSKQAARRNKKVKVHLKIDTGMGRLGVFTEEGIRLAKYISRRKNLQLEGIFTHFPDAEDRRFTLSQIRRFKAFLRGVIREGINFVYQHSANSTAFLNSPETWLNLIRPGLILYGIYPNLYLSKKFKLKPVLSWRTKVVYIKDIPKGWSVSYGRTWIAPKRERIAVLAIGYGEGYFHSLSNKARVLIKGDSFPIVGNVCMDQTMVRVNGDVKIGDEVILIGQQGDKQIKVEELAKLGKTIPYEIVCRLSHLAHIYKR
ncbi:MAG: alanine racemase [Candidatus Omnitrophica bacterium 4484_213]|nr:MAG: alanine racemase [Candidatus Omnitrophica bacterium 4484_213]